MPIPSLRYRLALTYAGMALLTAIILGGIMLGVLAGYYRHAEERYLRASAEMIAGETLPMTDPAALTTWAQSAALTTDTRVRVYDPAGTLLADSGPPAALDAGAIMHPGMGMGQGHMGHDRGGLPGMLGGGLFGGSGGSRSKRTLELPLSGGNGAYVQLSEAPASGRDALLSAAEAWVLAAALAVALAALAGYVISRRISRPVVALTAASDRMAEGDLAARAPVVGGDEVGRLGESFNTMAAQMETTVSTLRRFVADAAHELGTPLTALQADLELAQRAAASDDEKRLVGRSLEQTQRLEALSAGLLQLSRLEAGGAPAAAARSDAASAARSAADAVASRAEQAGQELVVEIADGPLFVAAEPAELQAILGNLLDNAVKFTQEGGTVTLRVQPDSGTAGPAAPAGDDSAPRRPQPQPQPQPSPQPQSGTVAITVTDTGLGIPADDQAQVFSRFHRARNVAAYPGSGLGLAIVKAAVERRRGSITFESDETGTAFRVSLPSS
jgi:signal transduction histidine kinase